MTMTKMTMILTNLKMTYGNKKVHVYANRTCTYKKYFKTSIAEMRQTQNG